MVDQAIEAAMDRLAGRYKGPGGLAAVMREGRVIASRAWGYADMATRQPMTEATRLPICSISKQFTCALLLDLGLEMDAVHPLVRACLPGFTGTLPTLQQLADNQSGLRDYWALTVLQGAFPEQEFRRTDALPLLARMKTGHFEPGTSYSYCNNNFRILGEVIEAETGRPLSELLAQMFARVGMTHAELRPDTRRNADGVVGYEGNDAVGFMPALNGIYWAGDAGISASLADMLAWEAYIDASRADPAGIYNRLSRNPIFKGGEKASYGNGLKHDVVAGHATTGHGGALRGFRAHRIHAADARLSVVVMFNHEADAHGAAYALMQTALGQPEAAPGAAAGPDWAGLWLDEERSMLARLEPAAQGVTLHYGTTPALLQLDKTGASGGGVAITRQGADLVMQRPTENLTLTARPLTPIDHADGAEISGRYWSDELEARLTISAAGGGTYAAFDGLLGAGPAERMYPQAQDVWIIPTRRSMDASPPGDWTVLIHRDAGGVTGLTLGCWLARGLEYKRR
jgi:D-aminopeptidase